MFQIFCDFDGTISQQDSLRLLFEEFLPETWPPLAKKMHSKEISEREALRRAFESIRISPKEAEEWVLDNISLDPSFKDFVAWAQENRCSLKILSGGISSFIRKLLQSEGLESLEVLANHWNEAFVPLHQSPPACANFSHCKCLSLKSARLSEYRSVYIGDGWTDRCPAQYVDFVFAKAALAEYCKERNIPFIPYENFADVCSSLKSKAF